MKDIKELIKSLSDYMENKGYTQRDIANKFDVDESTVSRWFSGGNISKKHKARIAFFLAGDDTGVSLPGGDLAYQCQITGGKCPLDPDDHLKIAVVKKIMQLNDQQLALLIGHIEQIKKENLRTPEKKTKAG